MNTLSIFLGSSFRLSYERVLIGDGIRKLSDEWEKKGVRIHLLIWEDYRSEYTGMSKQKEYDRDLVEKSDIVFAMFKDAVGPWTEHELDVALRSKSPNIHSYCLPHANRPNVVSQLKGKGINVIEVNNGDTIFSHIKQTIESYIVSNNLTTSNITTYPAKCIYATIPSDMKTYRIQLGNVIRSIDMLAERQLMLRCRLLPYNKEELISTCTDHYIALFNTKVNKAVEHEFQLAIDALDAHRRLVAVTVFKKSGGQILDNPGIISKTLKEKEIFTVGIGSSTDRLYLKLLLWIYFSVFQRIDVNDANISFCNNKILFFGCPIADISAIDRGQNIRNCIKQCQELETRFQVVSQGTAPDKNNRLFTLSSNINALSSRIMQMIVLELNQLLYDPTKYAVDETQELNVDELLDAASIEAETLSLLKSYYQGNWNLSQQTIYNRIEYLRKNISSTEDINILANLLDARNSILQLALDNGFIPAEALMGSLLYSVAIVDTYISGQITYDEDALFRRITQLADSYHVTSPMIEMMRLNLGNAHARVDEYDRAIECYRTALVNFRQFDYSKPAVRRYLSHLYMTAIMKSVSFYPHNPELKNWISEFMQLSQQWYSQDSTFVIERAQALTCYLAEIEFEAYFGKDEASEAEEIMDILMRNNNLSPDDHIYGDVYCFLPNAIGRYYLEQMALVEKADTKEYYYKAGKYLNICLKNVNRLENINYSEYLTYASNAHHNLGLLHVTHDYNKALYHYREALSLRRKLFEATQNLRYERDIAETLVNTCWVYIYYISDNMSEKPSGDISLPENPVIIASEALNIHKKYYIEGVLGLETKYYTALLLNGYLHLLLSCTSISTDAEYGMQCLKQCAEWDRQRPNNDQHHRIQDILQRVNLE